MWYITKVTTKLFLGNWQIINIKNLFCFILNLIVLLFQNSNLLTRKSQFHIRFGLTKKQTNKKIIPDSKGLGSVFIFCTQCDRANNTEVESQFQVRNP